MSKKMREILYWIAVAVAVITTIILVYGIIISLI